MAKKGAMCYAAAMVAENLTPPAPLAYGPLALATPLVLSPLAGYTNLPFRLVLREVGGVGLCTTDLVNARSLIERNPKALKLIETAPADKPLGIQLFGADAEEMAEAARICQAHGAQTVDINMGCPVDKVCKKDGGSKLMCTPDLARRIAESVRSALPDGITPGPRPPASGPSRATPARTTPRSGRASGWSRA